MPRPRRLAVLTTGRADYGQLYWLLRGARADRTLRLQLVVTGSHLDRAQGRTVAEIRRDGFRPAAEVPMTPRRDDPEGAALAVARGTAGFARALARLKPDLLVVLGDRFELLAACAAATALRVPIAHLHGGEVTEGVLDEQVRHAVTKLSHLHFTAAEPYRRRVVGMGEDPRRVFNFGAPAVEALRRLTYLDRAELERRLGLSLAPPVLLVTWHPASLSGAEAASGVEPILRAVARSGARAVITFANADAGGRAVNARVKAFAAGRPGVRAVAALGRTGYLSLMRLCSAVVGNSSSGIAEAPSLKVPTVNAGDRQKGRLKAPSVIDCAPTEAAVLKAIRLALTPAFRRARCRGVNPYGSGRTAERILRVLKTVPLGERLLRKRFHDA